MLFVNIKKIIMRYIYIIILFSFLLSCNNKSKRESHAMQETFENKKKVDKNKSAIMSDSLYCTISNYINRIDGFFFDKEWLYYNLLFF
jgi:hypothetical protein